MTPAGAKDLVLLLLIEPGELGSLAACIFAVDLDQAGYEELLFLVCLRLPVVLLAKRDDEANVSRPFLMVLVDLRAGKRFNV